MILYRDYKIVIEYIYGNFLMDGKYFHNDDETARIFHRKSIEEVKEEIDELIANEE